jgi:hypothetical protein
MNQSINHIFENFIRIIPYFGKWQKHFFQTGVIQIVALQPQKGLSLFKRHA